MTFTYVFQYQTFTGDEFWCFLNRTLKLCCSWLFFFNLCTLNIKWKIMEGILNEKSSQKGGSGCFTLCLLELSWAGVFLTGFWNSSELGCRGEKREGSLFLKFALYVIILVIVDEWALIYLEYESILGLFFIICGCVSKTGVFSYCWMLQLCKFKKTMLYTMGWYL